uniref:Rieske domain-containing protein n=1 Tax=Dunaliella tertiolecta TaxID=3047 RepID=A0A7S3QM46_DUNTE|mmetsp:Transcript_5375/g.14480  ORF Transcript_5375/g.14480 Transcript_5375/m.14480 type:complete len:682 (+) Transcript_5375:97-2142(+)
MRSGSTSSECRGSVSGNGRGAVPAAAGGASRIKTPKQSSRIGHTVSTRVIRDAEPQPRGVDYEDPEKTFGMRRIGTKTFGKSHVVQTRNTPMAWLQNVPNIWTRNTLESRKHDELLELVVLNERLAGRESWEARRRLEYLKKRRSNWEAIYNYITTTDAAATLELVEEANRKVEEALYEQETTGVGAMQSKLLGLQDEISEARDKLRTSEARVAQNLKRVDELKAEAASLERMRLASSSSTDSTVSIASRGGAAVAATTSVPDQVEREGIQSRVRGSGMASTSYPSHVPQPSQAVRRGPKPKDSRRLRSSLELEDGLRNFWYPTEFAKKLEPGMMVPFDLFGVPWVLFRDEHSAPTCIKDSCAHRACPLSLGKVINGHVQCPYHGWEFDGSGACTKMPSTRMCHGVGVAALPCVEKDGFVWVWPGDGPPPDLPPDFTAPPAGYDVHAEIMVDVPVEHGLLMENLLDLAHAPFTHTTTFARGWPIPEAVRFHATKMLAGDWDPYPISMSFNPPCIALSTIGLSQPGKIMRGYKAEECKRHLHQLHVCMPSKEGHTRLLYRMSLDFWGWAKHVPFVDVLWKKIAGQVLGEDLVLVLGQQARMIGGDDTWCTPMPYDKLAVRYRRWRNMVADGEYEEGSRIAAQANMTAGQMFDSHDDEDLYEHQRHDEGNLQGQQSSVFAARK